MQVVKAALGPMPFFKEADDTAEDAAVESVATLEVGHARPAVLADGSYATQTALADTFTLGSVGSNTPNLRCARAGDAGAL